MCELLEAGIWRVPLPLPFGPQAVNVYFVPCEGGWLLVDTGMPAEACWQALLEAVSFTGLDPARLRHIVLTHMHPDHCGLAPRLRQLTGALIWLHNEDAHLLRQWKHSLQLRRRLEEALEAAGTPELFREAVLAAHDEVVRLVPPFEPDRLLAGDDSFPTAAGPLRAVHTPGHSPGHCCLFAEEKGLLFSSDHVLESITPHAGWLPGENSLARYFASLAHVAALGATLVLPAHGAPFSDLASAVANIEATHRERLDAISALGSLASADEAIRRLWPRALHPLNYQLALTQVLAYREYLARERRP